jgi:hypothetical protein
MKQVVTLIISLFCSISDAQITPSGNSLSKDEFVSDYGTINLSYGRLFRFQNDPFQNYFRENYNSNFSQELEVFSLNVHSPVIIGNGFWEKTFDSNFGLNYRRSETLSTADSNSYYLRMFDFHLALGYDLLYFSKMFDLPVRLGKNFGMATLETETDHYRNPFFSFFIQAEPRITLWKIAISARGEMGFDITSKNWKPKSDLVNTTMPFKHNYKALVISVGIRFM